jgi:hypothetical protein
VSSSLNRDAQFVNTYSLLRRQCGMAASSDQQRGIVQFLIENADSLYDLYCTRSRLSRASIVSEICEVHARFYSLAPELAHEACQYKRKNYSTPEKRQLHEAISDRDVSGVAHAIANGAVPADSEFVFVIFVQGHETHAAYYKVALQLMIAGLRFGPDFNWQLEATFLLCYDLNGAWMRFYFACGLDPNRDINSSLPLLNRAAIGKDPLGYVSALLEYGVVCNLQSDAIDCCLDALVNCSTTPISSDRGTDDPMAIAAACASKLERRTKLARVAAILLRHGAVPTYNTLKTSSQHKIVACAIAEEAWERRREATNLFALFWAD